VAFSVVRIRRDDPAEQFLVQLMLHSEPDLPGLKGPMAFPVFGRGRLLYALVGRGITADNIGEAAGYVIGACSCEVKKQNPGVDLLLSADWESWMQGRDTREPELPPLVGLS